MSAYDYMTMPGGPGGNDPAYQDWVSHTSYNNGTGGRNIANPADYSGYTAAGYQWDPLSHSWSRSPTQAGSRVNEFNTAANPSLAALMSQYSNGGLPGTGGGIGGGAGAGAGGSGAPGFYGGPAPAGVPGPSSVAQIKPPDMTASNAAIFSKAKDTAGSLARASLNSLNGELGASGMIGSGAQVQGTRDIVQGGAGMLADVNRTNAMNESAQAADFAKMGYTGDITQRGQDISSSVTQRGQDIQLQEANAQLAMASQDRYFKMLQLMMQMYGGGGSGGGGGFNPFA